MTQLITNSTYSYNVSNVYNYIFIDIKGHDSFITKFIRMRRLNNGLQVFKQPSALNEKDTLKKKAAPVTAINSIKLDPTKLAWTN